MTSSDVRSAGTPPPPDPVDQAVDLFLRHQRGESTQADKAALDATLQDPARARTLQRVERAWQAVGDYADSPELMVLREQALARARRSSVQRWLLPASAARKRWLAAASVTAAVLFLGLLTWQLSPYGFRPGVHKTAIGEQKLLELEDRSTIALDARTQLRVRYTTDARIIEITQGQAQFSVARDPARPFKVIAGNHTIVALGTVFTVEYVDDEVQVAMLEGRVAVLAPASARQTAGEAPAPIELTVGEALRVREDGHTDITHNADLQAATAWRQGQVIFHDEPLADAVRRMNRYSRVQVTVRDPELARLRISGLFDAGDTRAFADALQSYLPLAATYPTHEAIELHSRVR
jgi:transmembrane sensor